MELVLSNNAQKNFKRLPKPAQAKIRKKLLALPKNPLSGKKLVGELKDSWSIRAWPYRIIYKINAGEHRIEVSDIVHRQGAYR